MRRLPTAVCLALSMSVFAFAQTAHRVPFGSQGNAIELTISNTTSAVVRDVRVEIENAPPWLQFGTRRNTVPVVKANTHATIRFEFSVERSAPAGIEGIVSVGVASAGQTWSKNLRIVVLPPEEYGLFQNYPNPFNPTTTISYQLPEQASVRLAVYNLLGQEVAEIFEGEQPPGLHEQTWEAAAVASGVYFYQLLVREHSGESRVLRKMMHVVR